MKFFPEEVLFSVTAACNLNCAHCLRPRPQAKKSDNHLPASSAEAFLKKCARLKVKRVGFTGGEPFLELNFLCRLTRQALKSGILFDRIMTNAVWAKDPQGMRRALSKLHEAGFDGSICVSFDAFHKQDVRKVADFIKTAVDIWKRPDIISIAAVVGAKKNSTENKLASLARLLNCKLKKFGTHAAAITNNGIFIKIVTIDLVPISKESSIKYPWDGKWFKEDFCEGPGNVFFITPEGDVKPCCGYAADLEALTIGNIKDDSPAELLRNLKKNRFVRTVFNSGLSKIRKRLEKAGVKFPGKTSSHCYFCNYILTELDEKELEKCLD